MRQTLLMAAILLAFPGCRHVRPSEAFIPIPEKLPEAAPEGLRRLVQDLGHEDLAVRERAASALSERGRDPSSQIPAVQALRIAATFEDPEVRAQARRILRDLDRGESRVPLPGRSAFSLSGVASVVFELARFADGTLEMTVKLDDPTGYHEELFSGRTAEELTERLNAAAHSRGYSQFQATPDGTLCIGPASFKPGRPWNADTNRVADLGAWVDRVAADDRRLPADVRGAWVVQARTIDGGAFRRGILLRDLLVRADGRPMASIDDVRQAVREGAFRVLRPEFEKPDAGGPPASDSPPHLCDFGPVSVSWEGKSRHYSGVTRCFPDGRLESQIQDDAGAWEPIRADSFERLRERLNAAARARGLDAADFSLDETGTLKMGPVSYGLGLAETLKEHALPAWGLWIDRASREDGVTSAQVWGRLVVTGLAREGAAAKLGFREGDCLAGAGSPEDLGRMLARPEAVPVLRPRYRPVEIGR